MKKIIQIKTMHLFTPAFFKEEQICTEKIANQCTDTQSVRFDFTRKGRRLIKSSSTKDKNAIENDILKGNKVVQKSVSSKLQNPKRSLSRVKEHTQHVQQKIVKSYSISRYDTRRETQANESQQCFKSSSKWMAEAKDQFFRERMKTELSCRDVKQEMMKRITNKINFMKKMTSEGNKDPEFTHSASPERSLFKFDKLSDFCLKNINKSLKTYEKDLSRTKDKKYYQLKIENTILSHQLQQIRNVIVKNKEKEVEPEVNLGVIGNCIDVKGQQKVLKSHRLNSSHFKKKAKNIHKKIQKNIKNPFRMDDMHGWQVGIQKTQDFYI